MLFTENEIRDLEYHIFQTQLKDDIQKETNPINLQLLARKQRELRTCYLDLCNHTSSMQHSDEWEDMGDLTFGNDSHSSQDYFHLWDIHEMFHDMNAFEWDTNTDIILANNSQNNDTSIIEIPVSLTTLGNHYSTGECPLGKVYIPKNLTKFMKHNSHICTLKYNGNLLSRQSVNINMPWKCIHVS